MGIGKKSQTIPKWVRILVPSVVILIWLTLGSIGGPYFGKISEVASNDQATFLPESAESTKVNEELEKFQTSKTVPVVITFQNSNKSELTSAEIGEIASATTELTELEGVEGDISPPIISDDKQAAIVAVNVSNDAEFKELVPEIEQKLDDSNIDMTYHVSGPVGFAADLTKAFSGIDGLLLGVALAMVFIILLVVYRSPILPFIVLLNSIFALSAAILIVFYLAKADLITLNGQVQGILFILVVGAATDYALLYVARYKEELTRHAKTYEAIITSWKRSFEPIVAAGGTVIAGLLCLLLSDLNSNKALGPVGSIGIIMAIVSALTFLPALLLMFGRVAFWPRIPKFDSTKKSDIPRKGVWVQTANFIARHARPTWVITTGVLVVACLGLFQLKADGVPQSDLILGESSARDGQEIINEHFPGGSGTPAYIIASDKHIEELVAALDEDKGVASVALRANNSSSGTMPVGKAETELRETIRQSIESKFSAQPASPFAPSVDTLATEAYPFKNAVAKNVDGEVVIEATLSDDTYSIAAQSTIERLRGTLHEIDSSARIGGFSAIQLDAQTSAKHDRAVVIPTVLVVITLILMVLLRSVIAPILLLATTLLSFGATLGVSALLFNHVWNFPGADPSVVLYGFIFLVALGIDYNIFLMTRVREESLRIGTRKGVLRGLIVTGGVITSAGVVLASTFAALNVIPILFLVQLAFIVAFGVLLDTIIVRSLLVPALVHDIGQRVWWPFNSRIK